MLTLALFVPEALEVPSAEEEAVVPGALSAPALPLALPARAPSAPRMRSKFNPLHQPEMAGSDSTATGLGWGGGGNATRSAGGLGRGATAAGRGNGAGLAFLTTAGCSTMYFGTGRAGTTTLGTGGRAAAGVVAGEFAADSDSACASAVVTDMARIMLTMVSEAPVASARRPPRYCLD